MDKETGKTNLPLIRPGRTKKDPMTVIGEIPGGQFFPAVKLTIRATSDDWNDLHTWGLTDPERLGRYIFLNFAEPVHDSQKEMGFRDRKTAFVTEARKYVAAVYAPALHYVLLSYEAWDDDFIEFLGLLNIDRIKYERCPFERHRKGNLTIPATWIDLGFKKRPDWWGYASLIVKQRPKLTPCQRPILTPLKLKKMSFSTL